MWHTGKDLACGAVGPRFKHFVGPILFCIRMVHYSSGEAVWFSARTLSFTNAASQWLYVNLICRFLSALVGFLRALRLPPTLKNRNPSIFPISRCVHKVCLAASGLITYVCAAAVTQRRLGNPVSWKSRITKPANYYFIIIKFLISEASRLSQLFKGKNKKQIVNIKIYVI